MLVIVYQLRVMNEFSRDNSTNKPVMASQSMSQSAPVAKEYDKIRYHAAAARNPSQTFNCWDTAQKARWIDAQDFMRQISYLDRAMPLITAGRKVPVRPPLKPIMSML